MQSKWQLFRHIAAAINRPCNLPKASEQKAIGNNKTEDGSGDSGSVISASHRRRSESQLRERSYIWLLCKLAGNCWKLGCRRFMKDRRVICGGAAHSIWRCVLWCLYSLSALRTVGLLSVWSVNISEAVVGRWRQLHGRYLPALLIDMFQQCIRYLRYGKHWFTYWRG